MFRPGPALTFPHARQQREAGLAAVQAGEHEVDLSGVESADSSAVATLLAWHRAARERGQSLSMRHPPVAVVSLARLYGVHEILFS